MQEKWQTIITCKERRAEEKGGYGSNEEGLNLQFNTWGC